MTESDLVNAKTWINLFAVITVVTPYVTKPCPQRWSACKGTQCTEEKLASESVRRSFACLVFSSTCLCDTCVCRQSWKTEETTVTLSEDTRWPQWKVAISALKATHAHTHPDAHTQRSLRLLRMMGRCWQFRPLMTHHQISDGPAQSESPECSELHLSQSLKS